MNSTEATVNGKAVKISAVPRIMNESTFVPLRFIAESVGGDVTWDEKTNTSISSLIRAIMSF